MDRNLFYTYRSIYYRKQYLNNLCFLFKVHSEACVAVAPGVSPL